MRQRRRHNSPGTTSKAALIESLLRLGDVVRNNQYGEVRAALEKARTLIKKYDQPQLLPRYAHLVQNLELAERGEPIKEHGKEEPKASKSSYDQWGRDWWQQTEEEREARRRQRAREKEHERQARADARTQRRGFARKDQPPYYRPDRGETIIWLWQWQRSPKRGKAGERWTAYYGAATIDEMLERGGKWSDVKWNIQHGYMKIKERAEE